MNFFKNVSKQYEQFWKTIILPGKQQYSIGDLGPVIRELNGVNVLRTDVKVENERKEILECSYYRPEWMLESKRRDLPYIIYLHGSGGSRLESLSCLSHAIPNYALFCFDFSGSGKSGGQFVTMGLRESQDVKSILSFIKREFSESKPILWGRSMGAVTGILFASEGNNSNNIETLVLDSPYSDLKQVMSEVAQQKTKIPGLLIDAGILLISQKIESELQGVDIFSSNIKERMKLVKCPTMFILAVDDNVILPHHARDLHKLSTSNRKYIIEVQGNHNTMRPTHLYHQIFKFFEQVKLDISQVQQMAQNSNRCESPAINLSLRRKTSESLVSGVNKSNFQTPTQSPNKIVQTQRITPVKHISLTATKFKTEMDSAQGRNPAVIRSYDLSNRQTSANSSAVNSARDSSLPNQRPRKKIFSDDSNKITSDMSKCVDNQNLLRTSQESQPMQLLNRGLSQTNQHTSFRQQSSYQQVPLFQKRTQRREEVSQSLEIKTPTENPFRQPTVVHIELGNQRRLLGQEKNTQIKQNLQQSTDFVIESHRSIEKYEDIPLSQLNSFRQRHRLNQNLNPKQSDRYQASAGQISPTPSIVINDKFPNSKVLQNNISSSNHQEKEAKFQQSNRFESAVYTKDQSIRQNTQGYNKFFGFEGTRSTSLFEKVIKELENNRTKLN